MSNGQPIRIATRGSVLARWQAARVGALLGEPFALVIVASEGDQRPDVPIHEIGGVGVFTAAIQTAVLRGEADVAVHSAKDLPARTHDAMCLAAFPERADVRDALVGAALAELPSGATVATGSVRRRAQLAALRPDLTFVELRGNIDTRITRARATGAGVVAYAALERLERTTDAAEVLSAAVMVPQVGQGALAVECRADDTATIARLAPIDSPEVRDALTAERAFLDMLGGGCTLPCGGWARRDDDALVFDAFLGSLDGETAISVQERAEDNELADAFGRRVAAALLAHGGAALLESGARP
ncbi:MAG: hydroxymethylbilane synthase [Acidimicrobiia bacterium]